MLKLFQGGIVSRGGNYENQARTNENNSEGAASLWKMLASWLAVQLVVQLVVVGNANPHHK